MADCYYFTFDHRVFGGDDAFAAWIDRKCAIARFRLALLPAELQPVTVHRTLDRTSRGDHRVRLQLVHPTHCATPHPSALDQSLAEMLALSPRHSLQDVQDLFELEFVERAEYAEPEKKVLCCSMLDPVTQLRSAVLYVKELRGRPPLTDEGHRLLHHTIESHCGLQVASVRKLRATDGLFYVDVHENNHPSAQALFATLNDFRLPCVLPTVTVRPPRVKHRT
jgi:hypothetical protein